MKEHLDVILAKAKQCATPSTANMVESLSMMLRSAVVLLEVSQRPVRRELQLEDDPNAVFEERAEIFYKETGLLAPGKSLPLEMSSEEMDQKRQQAWDIWRKELRRKTIDNLRLLVHRIDEFSALLAETAEGAKTAP